MSIMLTEYWLSLSGGTDRLGELFSNYSISNNQMISIHTWIPDCDSHSPAFLDLFHSSDASICPTMAFPRLKNSDQIFVSFSIDFPLN